MRHPILLLLLGALLTGCPASEAPRIELPLVVDASGMAPTVTDLGYTVELSEARVVVRDFAFMVRGEVHPVAAAPAWYERLGALVVRPALAHPGHFHGGEISGELNGRFVVDWMGGDGAQLGVATLLGGDYESANFALERAGADDVSVGDALHERTAVLVGVARRDGQDHPFVATIESPAGREVVGIPFEFSLEENTRGRLGFRLLPTDPFEGDSLFDGLDFAALPTDTDGVVVLAEPPAASAADDDGDEALRQAYYRLRRTFQTHDHFDVRLIEE